MTCLLVQDVTDYWLEEGGVEGISMQFEM